MEGLATDPSDAQDGSRSISSAMLELVKIHDPQAWTKLVDVWGPVIYDWCRRADVQASDAEDIVQNVLLQVATKVAQFKRKTFRGWIWKITANRIIDHFRSVKRLPRSVGGSGMIRWITNLADPDADDIEEPAALSSDCLIVRRLLDVIRNDFKESTYQAFWRMAVEGQSSTVVAEDLGITKETARKRKSRVLQRLREELEGMLQTRSEDASEGSSSSQHQDVC